MTTIRFPDDGLEQLSYLVGQLLWFASQNQWTREGCFNEARRLVEENVESWRVPETREEPDPADLWGTAWNAYYAAYSEFQARNPNWKAFFSQHHVSALDAAIRAYEEAREPVSSPTPGESSLTVHGPTETAELAWCNCQGGPQGPWHPRGDDTCEHRDTQADPALHITDTDRHDMSVNRQLCDTTQAEETPEPSFHGMPGDKLHEWDGTEIAADCRCDACRKPRALGDSPGWTPAKGDKVRRIFKRGGVGTVVKVNNDEFVTVRWSDLTDNEIDVGNLEPCDPPAPPGDESTHYVGDSCPGGHREGQE